MIPQLAKLNKEEYLMLMDRPTYLETTDSIIVFEDPNEDYWAKTDINLNQMIMIPFSLILLSLSFYLGGFFCLFYFILGCLVWTAIEYKEHRFSLHNEETIPEKFTQEEMMKFYSGHHVHHMFANQEHRIVVSLSYIFKTVIMGFAVEYVVLGVVPALAFTSGLALSQIFYDSMHFWFHFGGDFRIKYF